MDLLGSPRKSTVRREPRARGDGPDTHAPDTDPHQRAPRTRGWTARRSWCARAGYESPAHAGMDLLPVGHVAGTVRESRARGDGPAWGPPPLDTGPTSRTPLASLPATGQLGSQPRTIDLGVVPTIHR